MTLRSFRASPKRASLQTPEAVRCPWVLFLLLAAAPLSAQDDSRPDRAADLEALADWIERENGWPEGAEAAARARLADLAASMAEPVDAAAFYLAVASVVALADNGHSNVSTGPVYQRFGMLPIRVYWFADGLHVVRAIPEQAGLLGARVEAIGGHTPDALVEAMGAYHGGTDEFFRAYYANPFLLSPRLLHAAGLVDSPDRLVLDVTDQEGAARRVELETYVTDGRHPGARPWRYLAPEALPGEGDGWRTAGPPEDGLPWALQAVGEIFRYRFLPGDSVAHIQLRQNIGRDGERIRDFLDDVKDRLEDDRPRYVILDNRQNGGGDLTRSARFALELPELIPGDGRVFSLTSNTTFSAGIYTAFLPEAADDERTLVVGERVGDRERFWAESDGPFRLPSSGLGIGYSLELHDLGAGCREDACHLGRRPWNVAVGSFDPEVRVATTFADYAAGRDPQVEYVRRRIADGG